MEEIKVGLDKKEIICPQGHIIWDEARVAQERKECEEDEFPGTHSIIEVYCEKCGCLYEIGLQYAGEWVCVASFKDTDMIAPCPACNIDEGHGVISLSKLLTFLAAK